MLVSPALVYDLEDGDAIRPRPCSRMQLFLVTQPMRMSALEVTLTSLHSERTNKLYKEADSFQQISHGPMPLDSMFVLWAVCTTSCLKINRALFKAIIRREPSARPILGCWGEHFSAIYTSVHELVVFSVPIHIYSNG